MISSLVSEDVVLVRTEPSDQSPCPDQTVEYECQIMTPATSLVWTLPNGERLTEFDGFSDIGDNRTSGVYTATLTNREEDDNPDTNRFIFTSTLLIIGATNGSVLRCSGTVGLEIVEGDATIILSGKY